ncbi:MAG: UbiA family prenyltransferase [Planctomycetia bacterium]|nr:UbiA family prenyltransferase [Planctomycetia bacterium]
MRDWLRFVRAPLCLTAAFDAVACAALARGPGLGSGAPALTWRDGLLLAATSVLVYLAGMGGNDLADRRRDRTLHPDRPLPSGRIAPAAALVVVLLLAAGAVALGGGPAGHRGVVVGALVAAAAYDLGAKRRVVPGVVAMGSVRALNAATGVAPLVAAGLASPWALAGPVLVGLYAAGITFLSTAEDRPQREARARLVARGATVVAFGGGGALAMLGAAGVTFPALFAFPVVLSAVFDRVPRKGPAKRQVLEMLLGYFWLDAVLAGGAAPGSDWAWALASLGAAYAAIVGSQLAVRALR